MRVLQPLSLSAISTAETVRVSTLALDISPTLRQIVRCCQTLAAPLNVLFVAVDFDQVFALRRLCAQKETFRRPKPMTASIWDLGCYCGRTIGPLWHDDSQKSQLLQEKNRYRIPAQLPDSACPGPSTSLHGCANSIIPAKGLTSHSTHPTRTLGTYKLNLVSAHGVCLQVFAAHSRIEGHCCSGTALTHRPHFSAVV